MSENISPSMNLVDLKDKLENSRNRYVRNCSAVFGRMSANNLTPTKRYQALEWTSKSMEMAKKQSRDAKACTPADNVEDLNWTEMEDAALAEVERAKSCALFDATTGGALQVSHNVEIDAKLDLILRQFTGVNAGIKAGVRLQNSSQKQGYCVGWYALYLSAIEHNASTVATMRSSDASNLAGFNLLPLPSLDGDALSPPDLNPIESPGDIEMLTNSQINMWLDFLGSECPRQRSLPMKKQNLLDLHCTVDRARVTQWRERLVQVNREVTENRAAFERAGGMEDDNNGNDVDIVPSFA